MHAAQLYANIVWHRGHSARVFVRLACQDAKCEAGLPYCGHATLEVTDVSCYSTGYELGVTLYLPSFLSCSYVCDVFRSSSCKGNSKKRSRFAMAGDGDGSGNPKGAPISGTSMSLEKSYFRLTSAPDPANVRPPAVLRVRAFSISTFQYYFLERRGRYVYRKKY